MNDSRSVIAARIGSIKCSLVINCSNYGSGGCDPILNIDGKCFSRIIIHGSRRTICDGTIVKEADGHIIIVTTFCYSLKVDIVIITQR